MSIALQPRRSLLTAPVAVGGVGAGLALALHFHDPHQSGSWGLCPFLMITGRPCPGCGGLRAINDLTRGDLLAAVSSNVLAVALVGILGVAWVLWLGRRLRGVEDRMIALSPRVSLAAAAVVVGFGVLRNLPFGAWLAP